MIEAQYTLGGVPNILIPSDMVGGSGLCGAELKTTGAQGGKAAALNSSNHLAPIPSGLVITLFCFLLAMPTLGFAMLF
jgi:alpha-amylase